ncbi:unnamed protein product, partial [Oppiella nova]
QYHGFSEFYANEVQITHITLASNNYLYQTVFDGYYVKTFDELSVIGQGGFGIVFRVKHAYDGQVYAVKRIQYKETVKVLREVENLVKVKSEYVVQYYHSWRETRCLYIQMEFCSQNLTNILEVKPHIFERQSGDPMDLYEYFISCDIFQQILECVQYLHELNPQIIHRDLKPDNILIAENIRNGRFVKLCDFGLATVHDKTIHYKSERKHTSDIGDLRYQAPEIGHGKKYGHKSDIYSLALISGEIFDVDVVLIEPKKKLK